MACLQTSVAVATDLDTAWQSFTDAARFSAWFWPAAFDTVVVIDPRVGGGWSARSKSVGIGVSGVFSQIERGRMLRTTWAWDDEPESTRVAIAFRPRVDETAIVVTHEGFGSNSTRDEHIEGWDDCLGRLVARYAREASAPTAR